MVGFMNDAILRAVTAVSELRGRLAEERGQDLLEYALLSGMIAAALAGVAFIAMNTAIIDMVGDIAACIDFDTTGCG